MNVTNKEDSYKLQPPRSRCIEQHASIMYMLSKREQLPDSYRPNINVRSNKKLKFRTLKGNMQMFLEDC